MGQLAVVKGVIYRRAKKNGGRALLFFFFLIYLVEFAHFVVHVMTLLWCLFLRKIQLTAFG